MNHNLGEIMSKRTIGTASAICFDGPCKPWTKLGCRSCGVRPLKLYVGDGVYKYIPWMKENGFGALFVDQFRKPENYPYYALDNGAFSAWNNDREWNGKKFFKHLDRAMKEKIKPDFVVVPDLVAKGEVSLLYSVDWMSILPSGPEYYLAIQDGMTERMVEKVEHLFDGFFVGGTMEWKLRSSEAWVNFSHRVGKPCHIGRIGPWERIIWAARIGADSIDSTTWVREDRRYHIEKAKLQNLLEVA